MDDTQAHYIDDHIAIFLKNNVTLCVRVTYVLFRCAMSTRSMYSFYAFLSASVLVLVGLLVSKEKRNDETLEQ